MSGMSTMSGMSISGGRLRIGVIGAGVVGLSTALRILQKLPREAVHLEVLAEKFDVDTTSDGAAGLFRPVMTPYTNQNEEQFKNWSRTSWERYSSLFYSSEAEDIGIIQVGGYHIFSEPFSDNQKPPVYKDIVYHVHECSESELGSFPPVEGKSWKSGYYFNSLVLECRRYLPWLSKTILSMGGKLIKETVPSLQSLRGRYDVVFNCCGFGARSLVGDENVVPIRGQLVRAHAPQLKHFYFFDDDCYIVPCFDSLVLGVVWGEMESANIKFKDDVPRGTKDDVPRGTTDTPSTSPSVARSDGRTTDVQTCCYLPRRDSSKDAFNKGGIRQLGDFNTEVCEHDKEEVLRRATTYLPTLKDCQVKWDWAGLRPHRDPVRVELENYPIDTSKLSSTASASAPTAGGIYSSSSSSSSSSSTHLLVVHNYGHGGHGVTLSWGTAVDSVQLLLDHLKKTNK